jgi:hypothetical protein
VPDPCANSAGRQVTEFAVNYTYLPVYVSVYAHSPTEFWDWLVPHNVAIKVEFMRSFSCTGNLRTSPILTLVILIFLFPYWYHAP